MVDQEKVREGVRLILEGIGEDVNREGLDGDTGPYCENVLRAGRRHG